MNKNLHNKLLASGKEKSLRNTFAKKNNYTFFNPLNRVDNYLIGSYQNNNFKLDPDFDFIMISNPDFLIEDANAGDMLDFVSDLFGELKSSYNKKMVKKGFSPTTEPIINFRNMNPNSVNFSNAYRTRVQKTIKNFLNNYCKNYEVQSRITNLSSFLNEFFKFCLMLGKELSITKQSYINKKSYTHKNCGLIFEFTLDDVNNDIEKFNKYLGEANTEYMAFVDLASRFGFYPNYRMPNQFICNLNEYSVLQAAYRRIIIHNLQKRLRRPPTIDQIEKEVKSKLGETITYKRMLEHYFVKAYTTDFDDFISFIGYAYNQFCASFPTNITFDVKSQEFMEITKNQRNTLSFKQLNSIIEKRTFYKIYFLIRTLESNAFSFGKDISKITKGIEDLSQTLDNDAMLRYINEQVKRLTINRALY